VMLRTDIRSCRVYHWFESRNMRPKRIRETPHRRKRHSQGDVEIQFMEKTIEIFADIPL